MQDSLNLLFREHGLPSQASHQLLAGTKTEQIAPRLLMAAQTMVYHGGVVNRAGFHSCVASISSC